MTKVGGLLLFLSIFFFLNFSIQSSLLFGQCVWRFGFGFGFGFQRWDFYWVWPKGVCVLICGFVSSGYFQGLGFEDISKLVYWVVWPWCVCPVFMYKCESEHV
ncbi:hypothetical protein ACB092_11G140000 [Castanea dentata]